MLCVCVRAVIRCQELVDPDHGVIQCDSETLYGSRCELHCHSGFTAVGQPSIECLDHGRWSHDSPLCAGLLTTTDISRGFIPDKITSLKKSKLDEIHPVYLLNKS